MNYVNHVNPHLTPSGPPYRYLEPFLSLLYTSGSSARDPEGTKKGPINYRTSSC